MDTRRRILTNEEVEEELPVFEIVHPDYWWFKITTTTANKKVNIYYAHRIDKLYIDGVECAATKSVYESTYGRAVFSTPNTYDVWVHPDEGWDANSKRLYCSSTMVEAYLGNNISVIISANTSIKTLYLTASTPPAFSQGGNLAGVETIYVPKELVSVYRNNTNWRTFAAKIKPCEFVTISN